MRQTIKIFFFTILFSSFLYSCEERVADEPELPVWVQTRVAELQDMDSCLGCTIKRSTYKEEHFYHVYCNHWSCSHCEVYHHDGTLVDWQVINHQDWMLNQTQPEIVWECPQEEPAE